MATSKKEVDMSSKRLMGILLAILLLFAAPALYGSGSGNCSLATLNGSYNFSEAATLVGDPALRMVTSGTIRFDGNGNHSGESITNVEGWGVGGVDTFTGTYAVNRDCTYSGDLTGGGVTFHFVGTITGAGMLQETRYVITDPGWVALGTVKRIQPAACSTATLKGSYVLFGEGTVTSFTPPAPLAHAGMVTYDGAGNFFGSDTIMLNGTMIPDTFTGTYAVTGECNISVDIASTAVGVVHESGWIVGQGKSTEVHLIVTDPGFVFQESTRKQ
jgi:hypothetical protein